MSAGGLEWWPFGVRDEAVSISLRGLRLLSFTSTRRYYIRFRALNSSFSNFATLPPCRGKTDTAGLPSGYVMDTSGGGTASNSSLLPGRWAVGLPMSPCTKEKCMPVKCISSSIHDRYAMLVCFCVCVCVCCACVCVCFGVCVCVCVCRNRWKGKDHIGSRVAVEVCVTVAASHHFLLASRTVSHTHAHTHTHTHTHTQVILVYACVCICILKCVFVHKCVFVNVYLYTHTHTCIHTLYAHVHTNIWLCKYSDVIMKPWKKMDTPAERANGGSRSTDFCVFVFVCKSHMLYTYTHIYQYSLSHSPFPSPHPLSVHIAVYLSLSLSLSLARSNYLCLFLSQCLFVFVCLSSVCVSLKHASLCLRRVDLCVFCLK
jgi:hypothetical protein